MLMKRSILHDPVSVLRHDSDGLKALKERLVHQALVAQEQAVFKLRFQHPLAVRPGPMPPLRPVKQPHGGVQLTLPEASHPLQKERGHTQGVGRRNVVPPEGRVFLGRAKSMRPVHDPMRLQACEHSTN